MKKTFLCAITAILMIAIGCNVDKPTIKVACIGNSITEGYGLAKQSSTGWPVVLNRILGDNYCVQNCGRSATTLQRHGDFPYYICKEFSNALLFNPDIVIIKTGTNDTKPNNWHEDAFIKDYQWLIDTLKSTRNNPRIILCKPVPAFDTIWGINDSIIVNGINPIIDKLAKKNNLEVLDLHEAMKDFEAHFPDKIHPDETAAAKIAEIVAAKIKQQ